MPERKRIREENLGFGQAVRRENRVDEEEIHRSKHGDAQENEDGYNNEGFCLINIFLYMIFCAHLHTYPYSSLCVFLKQLKKKIQMLRPPFSPQ